MTENEEYYNNLLTLIKLLQNQPNYLVSFLIENKALNSNFLKKVADSNKLTNIYNNGVREEEISFNDISEMKAYFNSIIKDINLKRKNKQAIIMEYNQRLQKSIIDEDYEESAKIRDYMRKNNIPKL